MTCMYMSSKKENNVPHASWQMLPSSIIKHGCEVSFDACTLRIAGQVYQRCQSSFPPTPMVKMTNNFPQIMSHVSLLAFQQFDISISH